MNTIRTALAALAASTLLATSASAKPGGLDPTFGTGGKERTDLIGANEYGTAVAITPGGKILQTGYLYSSGFTELALTCHNEDGSLDTAFGTGGVVRGNFSSGNDSGQAVAVQGDGKIVVAGNTQPSGGSDNFLVARFNTDGSLDTSFNGTGFASTDFAGNWDQAFSVAVDPIDGKILVAGRAENPLFSDFALARYNTDGTLDTSFGNLSTGRSLFDFSAGDDSARGVAVQGDGRIVVAGYSNSIVVNHFALTRFLGNGTLDTSFGASGTVITPVADEDLAYSVVIQPADGKIVAAGAASGTAGNFYALVRYNTNGGLDTTFGAGGKVVSPTGAGSGMALQDDGKFLVVGANFSGYNDFAVVRYQANGALDPVFGVGGVATTDFSGGTDIAYGVAIDPLTGKVVIGGQSDNGTTTDFALARYNVAQGDSRVGLNRSVPRGNNIFNLTGAGQVQPLTFTRLGGVKNVYFAIENESPDARSFMIRATRGNARFAVKYFHGLFNVTALATAGTLSTPMVPAGDKLIIRAQITAKTPRDRQQFKFSFFNTVTADGAATDRADALVKTRY